LAVQRKARRRRADDRHVEKAQARADGMALVVAVVEVELLGRQHPVLLLRPAGGVAGVESAEDVLAEELDARSVAARLLLALQEERRLLEEAGAVEQVVLHARPEEAVGAVDEAHAALALRAAELAVVAQLLAEDRGVALADLGVAARRHLDVAHT